MNRIFVFWIALSLVFAQVTSSKRHELYWNTYATPKLLVENNDEFVLHVKIGEFLDVMCPHSSLMGITNGPKEPAQFDLYNVTRKSYLKCHHGDKKNFIFACDKPERENKLTIKFQTISPSPLGFRFQYCEEYYFVAIDKSHKNRGCTKNSTRIRIVVQCKDKPVSTKKPTTTTTSTPSTTIKATTQRKKADPPFVHPKLQRPTKNSTVLSTGVRKQQKQDEPDYGGGACGQVAPSLWRILTFSFVALTITNIVRQAA
uniref:EphrinA-c ephrin n=1 Tax=Phallusia mammillata TaxID=59560 RepID=A0A6F9DAZ9_9ASCI|nr:EphrinA-c ephrin precursor [Phallusia mammillata]